MRAESNKSTLAFCVSSRYKFSSRHFHLISKKLQINSSNAFKIINWSTLNKVQVWTIGIKKKSRTGRTNWRHPDFNVKLNLKSFFVLWIWISLLGLASVEAQTFISFIFFLQAKSAIITWPKVAKKNIVLSSPLKIKSFTYSVKNSTVISDHLNNIYQTSYCHVSQYNFWANFFLFFMKPARGANCVHFLRKKKSRRRKHSTESSSSSC